MKIDENTNIINHNKKAWDLNVETKNRWTVPIDPQAIANAKNQNIKIILSPKTAIPNQWLGNVKEKNILGLAAGGGQQGPLLAAAGANVTVVDLSSKQLEQDQLVAKRENLNIKTIETSADNLSMFANESFDIIINPTSNCFFEKLGPVWNECARLLKPNGILVFAFINPVFYCFDLEKVQKKEYTLKYPLPYSDIHSLSLEERSKFLGAETPMEFGHTLSEQIGLLLKAGFHMTDFFEDNWDHQDELEKFFPQFINIRAVKIASNI